MRSVASSVVRSVVWKVVKSVARNVEWNILRNVVKMFRSAHCLSAVLRCLLLKFPNHVFLLFYSLSISTKKQ